MPNKDVTLDTSNEQNEEITTSPEKGNESEEAAPVVTEQQPKKEYSEADKKLFAVQKELELAKKKLARLANGDSPEEKPKAKPKEDSLTREEVRAYAKGFDDEDIADAKLIAERNGLTLTEAFEHRQFKALKADRDAEIRSQKAAMRPTEGGSTAKKTTLKTEGLTPEEHKRLWKESQK